MSENKYEARVREELEAVKKERDSLKGTATKSWVALTFERNEHKKVKDRLSEVTRQRDEAMKLLKRIKSNLPDNAPWSRDYNTFLSRLSSGETKPASTTPDEYPGKAYQPLFDHMSKAHNLTLLESEMHEIISVVREIDSPWISVESTLPQEGRYVFIYDKYEGRDIGYYKEGVWFEKDSQRERKYVTHYCEFPTSPNLKPIKHQNHDRGRSRNPFHRIFQRLG